MKFAYVHHLQGDIVAILDRGRNVVVSYVYDAWGCPIKKEGCLASTLVLCSRSAIRNEGGLNLLKMELKVSDFSPHQDSFPLWSVICVQFEGVSFPDDKWWDATSSVLDMWIKSVNSLLSGSAKSCSLPFLDGDYSIRMISKGQRIVLVQWLHDEILVAQYEDVDLLHFVRQLIAAATQVLEYEKHAGSKEIVDWLTKSLDQIKRNYHHIKGY